MTKRKNFYRSLLSNDEQHSFLGERSEASLYSNTGKFRGNFLFTAQYLFKLAVFLIFAERLRQDSETNQLHTKFWLPPDNTWIGFCKEKRANFGSFDDIRHVRSRLFHV